MDLIKVLDDCILSQKQDENRLYIGASSIGHDCMRSIWYGFNGVDSTPIPAKLKRTFEVGKKLELMIIEYFDLAGFKIIKPSEENNYLYCQDSDIPKFQGHIDALLYLTENNPIVLEIKTAARDEYKKFVDNGVKSWRPVYYAQVQAYMGMMGLKSAVLFIINKNDSDWHCEWIEFDDLFYDELKAKALEIIKSIDAPEKLNKNPSYWICQMCRFKEICHKPVISH